PSSTSCSTCNAYSLFFSHLISPVPSSTLFPYTTLFRSGLFGIGRIPGIARPALSPTIPTIDGKGFLLLDVGANVDEEKSFTIDRDRKSTRLNSSHVSISYAVFCLKKKKRLTKHYNN